MLRVFIIDFDLSSKTVYELVNHIKCDILIIPINSIHDLVMGANLIFMLIKVLQQDLKMLKKC